MTEKPLLFADLPALFEVAETCANWSAVLMKLETLAKTGKLNPLPDWLAVEILWMAVQFEQMLLQPKQPVKKKEAKKKLTALKKLACWQQVVHFDKQFPLVDGDYLASQGVSAKPKTLSQFLALADSKAVSPHRLFNLSRYCSLHRLDKALQHPVVHFFRHSSGYQSGASATVPYFDVEWYRQTYLQGQAYRHPLLHYLQNFQKLKFQPAPHFYSDYVRQTQKLAADVEPLSFYLQALAEQGLDFCLNGFSPCPYFDRAFYLAQYPDIKVSAENGKLEPFQHFSTWGLTEDRCADPWFTPDMFRPALLPDFLGKKRQAVLVLGMHRSGTSALTRVINLLGMALPAHLVDPDAGNETGYWESFELAAMYHDRILAEFGSRWDDPLPIAARHRHSDAWFRYRLVLAYFIVREFAQVEGFVLKDPRMCKLVPLWLEALHDLNIEVKVVLPVRNPLEIAGSLAARDGFSPEKVFLLWLHYVLDAERDTRGLMRCIVSYSDLLTQPEQVVAAMANRCQMEWPNDNQETLDDIRNFINPNQYRQRLNEDWLTDGSVSAWVVQVYQALKGWSQGVAADEGADRRVLDGVGKEIALANALHGQIIADQQRDLQALFMLYQQKKVQIQQLFEQNADMEVLVKQNGLK